jgi:hypothetical protein
MKKIILVLLAILVMGSAVTANTDNWFSKKIYYGLRLGRYSPLAPDSTNSGTIGIFAGYNLNENFALQMELNYFSVQTPDNMSTFCGGYGMTQQYIQVPFLLKENYLTLGWFSLYLEVGPVLDLELPQTSGMGDMMPFSYRSLGGMAGLGMDFIFERGNAIEFEVKGDQSMVNNSSEAVYPGYLFFTAGYIF